MITSKRFGFAVFAIFFLNSNANGQPQPPPDPSTVPRHISSPQREAHGAFIDKAMKLILQQAVYFNEDRSTGPFNYKTKAELKQLIDYHLSDSATSDDDLLKIIENIIKYSPHPSHPYMLDKRVSGLDPYALAGDWMAATMSNLVVTYAVSPIWTLMELEMIKKFSSLLGWPNQADGVPTPGAGVANSMALALALAHKYPNFKEQGLFGRAKQPLIFISEHASYGYERAAVYQGIAAKNVIKVKVDALGKMDIGDLEAKLREANQPSNELVMVVGTAGTQVLGQIDNLHQIANIATTWGMWFHVDAEKAGGFIFMGGDKGPVTTGIGKANSVTIGTWMFSTPYVTTMLMVVDKTVLDNTFGLHASYVWTGNDLYDASIDTGDHTIQTSRRPEISKFFFAWRGRGRLGLVKHIDWTVKNKDSFLSKLKAKPNVFVPIVEKFDIPLVSFYVVPSSASRTDYNALSQVSERIHSNLLKQNLMAVTLSSLPEGGSVAIPQHPKFFITVSLTNSVLQDADLDYILSVIEDVANDRTPTVKPPAFSSGESFVNSPIKAQHDKFFSDAFKLFHEKGLFFKRSEPSSNFLQPEELAKKFDFHLGENAVSHDQLLGDFEKIITYSPHWGHPYFIYQLAAALDPFTLVADYVASSLNTPMINYRDSPVFTIMERQLVKTFQRRIYGREDGDGIITDGGSMGNHVAIALAKQYLVNKNKIGNLRDVGLSGDKKLTIFISEDGHYSPRKGAIVQSLGSSQTINVRATPQGRMDVKELRKEIEACKARGDIPLTVVITTGTTVYGAIDPVSEIIQVCRDYDIWCHVDGMFGGMLIMSDNHIHKISGSHNAHSFGVDLHKMMGSTMTCTAVITPFKDIFRQAFDVKDNSDLINDEDNRNSNGGKHWQVDKRNNMFKFWLLWKAKGRTGMGQHIEISMSNAAYMQQEVKARKDRGFLPAQDRFEVTNVCFFYIPPAMQALGLEVNSEPWKKTISAISFEIEKRVWRKRILNIVSQKRKSKDGDTGAFLKFIMMGSVLTKPDVIYILDMIEHVGKDINPADFGLNSRKAGSEYVEKFDPFGNQPDYTKKVVMRMAHPGLSSRGSDLRFGPSENTPETGQYPGLGLVNTSMVASWSNSHTTVCPTKNRPREAFNRAQARMNKGRRVSKTRSGSKTRTNRESKTKGSSKTKRSADSQNEWKSLTGADNTLPLESNSGKSQASRRQKRDLLGGVNVPKLGGKGWSSTNAP